MLTLDTVTVLLDSLAPPVMMVRKRESFIEQHTIPQLLSDIRECEFNNGSCDQICTDFPGGYSCSCRSGFEADGPSCIGMSFMLVIDKLMQWNVYKHLCQDYSGNTPLVINSTHLFPSIHSLCAIYTFRLKACTNVLLSAYKA